MMKIAILMDPLSAINPKKDTTVTFIEAAEKRGWEVVYFTYETMIWSEGHVFAQVATISILDIEKKHWCQVGEPARTRLDEFNIILMRKDPPFNMGYVYQTYLLEHLSKQGVLVTNRPDSIRNMNEKCSILSFPQCIAPTIVTASRQEIMAFYDIYEDIIVKPLDGMGGQNVFRIDKNGLNQGMILDFLTQEGTHFIMAQKYIPELPETGDKRILLVNGEPIPYALARFPKGKEVRANLRAGGTGKVVPLTKRDYFLSHEIGKNLVQQGIYFAGLDVIGDFVTEINVTSPTCVREIATETGIDIAGKYMDFLAL